MNQASQIPEKVLLAAVRGKLIQASLRRLIRWVSKVVPLPFGFLVETGCLERPAHAYCIWHSANLAKSLGYTSIGIAEFGVAAGATLLIIERYAKEVARVTGVDIRVYGFDTGAGLPKLAGVKDLPHWFRANMYTMDVGRLRERLDPRTTLVLGNVTDTVSEFFDEPRPPL
ncbi:MAG: hypothetical protein J0H62_04105, partial [Rhizobiales bacterium]|nr:hypothetical protein [Hyphomicrobiales bacterium]